jgi:beta-galactosidase
MCEYSHAMGNSNGTLAEYWDAIEATPGLQGGFIWEWRDHGLEQTLPDGTVRHAYGGDFGDVPNDGTFVLDGVTFPDRSPKPGLWEFRHLAAPVRVVSGAAGARDGRVVLESRGDFRDTSWLRATWALEIEGEHVAGGDLELPALAPDERREVVIPGFVAPGARDGEAFLTLRFTLAGGTEWAPAGFEVGWAQVPLADDPGSDATAPSRAFAAAAAMGGWTGDVPFGPEGLRHPALAALPSLALWRAPTDNDRIGGMADRWRGWGLHDLRPRNDGVERGPDAVTLRSSWRTASGIEVPLTIRISADARGRIRAEQTAEIPDTLADLSRVGTLLTFRPGMERITWFGTGPHETYPDRKRGGAVGLWTSTVTDQLTPYVRPQESGGHADVRWLELRDADGTGVRLIADRPRQVSALHVTAADLDAATHDVELRPRAETFVTLDAVHRGVGTASCGPDTLPPYLVPTGTHRWTWILEPLEAAAR